jgi:DNA-directed RNA polymerase subunit RPC12/RpoP
LTSKLWKEGLKVNKPDFVIKFRCKNCGQKISVPKIHAGKKGKCPKCKSIIVVPGEAERTGRASFKCSTCDEDIEVPESSRGKLIECPKCGCYVEVPSEKKPAETKKTPIEPRREEHISDKSPGEQQLEEGTEEEEETEPTGKRKLPWPIDILLYPTSIPGLVTIGVIVIGQLLSRFLCCAGWIVQIIMSLYLYWYFCECIRDSAAGGLRAPETIGSMAALGEMFWQYLGLFACYIFFLAPVTFYHGWTYYTNNEINGVIFWSLLTYGVFFFPMGLLAVVMFDSVRGLNPVLIIRSITSTFLQYFGLVILFYGLGILFVIIMMGSVLSGVAVGPIVSLVLTFIFNLVGFIWLLLIAGHLLGRFYWRYQDKLYWEV